MLIYLIVRRDVYICTMSTWACTWIEILFSNHPVFCPAECPVGGRGEVRRKTLVHQVLASLRLQHTNTTYWTVVSRLAG